MSPSDFQCVDPTPSKILAFVDDDSVKFRFRHGKGLDKACSRFYFPPRLVWPLGYRQSCTAHFVRTKGVERLHCYTLHTRILGKMRCQQIVIAKERNAAALLAELRRFFEGEDGLSGPSAAEHYDPPVASHRGESPYLFLSQVDDLTLRLVCVVGQHPPRACFRCNGARDLLQLASRKVGFELPMGHDLR